MHVNQTKQSLKQRLKPHQKKQAWGNYKSAIKLVPVNPHVLSNNAPCREQMHHTRILKTQIVFVSH